MKTRYISCLLGGLVLFGATALVSCSKSGSPAPDTGNGGNGNGGGVTTTRTYAAMADSMQTGTNKAYLAASGNYYIQNNTGNTTFNYWPQAHALDALIDAYLRTKSDVYKQRMKALLQGVKTTNQGTYINFYYDDMGWMANACMRGYAATNDADYLAAAQTLYTDIKTGYNNSQGGGIAWRKNQLDYKGIPATANGAILAARIYELQKNNDDLTLAKNLYSWMKATLVDPSTGVVWDGVNSTGTGAVDKNVYTYNQGNFIGSAVELYNATGDKAYLTDAMKTADNMLTDTRLTAAGILKPEGQGDGGLFKAVAARYLTVLTDVQGLDAAAKSRYEAFLQNNAVYLYTIGVTKPGYLAGPDWAQKVSGNVDLTTQLSGLIMMEMAAKLQAEGEIQ